MSATSLSWLFCNRMKTSSCQLEQWTALFYSAWSRGCTLYMLENKMPITVPFLRYVLHGYLAIALICSMMTNYQPQPFCAYNWLPSCMWPSTCVNWHTLVSAENRQRHCLQDRWPLAVHRPFKCHVQQVTAPSKQCRGIKITDYATCLRNKKIYELRQLSMASGAHNSSQKWNECQKMTSSSWLGA